MSDTAPARDRDSDRDSDRDTDPVGKHADRTGPDARTSPNGAPARTSAAAVFALVFGLMAFRAALTGLLAPVAVLFGLIGLILGILGIRAGKKPQTTGKGVAIGGLVLAVLGLLVGAAAIAGVASVVSSNPQILDQITNLLNNARSQVPTP